MLKIFIHIFLIVLATACVGTIDKAESEKTKFLDRTGSKMEYKGIVEANAIAQDKIEIYFYPFADSTDVEYKLYVNEAKVPIEIQPESLETHPSGRLRFVLKELNSGELYLLRIAAHDAATGAESQNETVMQVTTYTNPIADFTGVEQIKLFPGQTSSKIIIKWVSSPFVAALGAAPYDPAKYQITIVSENAGLENMNNSDYPLGEDKKIIYAPGSSTVSRNNNPGEEIVENLQPQTKYFVQVRMIHHLAWDNRNNVATYNGIQKDANTKAATITTEASTSLYDFNDQGLAVYSTSGEDAFTKLLLTWQAGSGSFTRYAVFYKKVYTEGETVVDPTSVDLLDTATLQAIVAAPSNTITDINGKVIAGRYYVSSQYNYYLLENLTRYTTYQVKVALCRSTLNCDIDLGNDADAMVSGVKYATTEPSLPPFSGITGILNPDSEDTSDEITVQFQTPTLSLGFADKLKIYCLDPDDPTDEALAFPLTTSALVGTSTVCDGLKITANLNIASSTYATVKGVNAYDQVKYCFGMTTYISEKLTNPIQHEKELDFENMVVRCIYPEITLPNNTEFIGFKNNCSVNEDKATLAWDKPTTGIYQGYKVFYREALGSETFSFVDAITGEPEYTTIEVNDSDIVQKTIDDLSIGKKYLVGVLAFFEDPQDNTNILYSEYNLGIKECNIPMPGATFDSFRRIFAVGPKVNGLFPRSLGGGNAYLDEAYIWETLDAVTGAVYEVADPDSLPVGNNTNKKRKKIGNDYFEASNRGIISLAWVNVKLSSENYDDAFEAGQAAQPTLYGYQIYRSDNNRLSWELMNEASLIHASNITYNRHINEPMTEAIATFIDYSVLHAPAQSEIGRAKIYYYRIIPIFNGKQVLYGSSSRHEIKVILPPENMALVSRKIANRSACIEMYKDNAAEGEGFIEQDEHYRCFYNGVGNSPLSFPWSSGGMVYDQGGDLLVDRFEMGCKFSRGVKDKVATGVALNLYTSTNMSQEVGCTTTWSGAAGTPDPDTGNYDRLLSGDCIGNNARSIHSNSEGCTDPGGPNHYTWNINYVGADRVSGCHVTSNYTNDAERKQRMTQSSFGAVYFNQGRTTGNTIHDTFEVVPSGSIDTSYFDKDCNINLASLDSQSYVRARWFSLNRLAQSDLNFLNKSISETMDDASLYGGTNFVKPTISGSAFKSSTKIARILTGNEAKLPPLNNVSTETAQKICGTYSVQLGISSTSGQFFSVSPAVSKRLLRRKEFIAAANHSEFLNYNDQNTPDPSDDTSEIADLEKNKCINSQYVGSKASVAINSSVYSSLLNGGFNGGYVQIAGLTITGSAKSKECVSRYGIQDLVGNVRELGPEKLFCDYNKETFDITTYNALGLGDYLARAPANRIWSKAKYYEIQTNGAQPVLVEDELMFGAGLSGNGYCSIVDNTITGFDPYGYQNAEGFVETFDAQGNLNTNVIKNTLTYDQEAVDGLRNGDGTYFHTGTGYLAPPLSSGSATVNIKWVSQGVAPTSAANPTHNNWDATNVVNFNPIVGLPLECGSEVNNCNSTGDNKIFTRNFELDENLYGHRIPYSVGRSNYTNLPQMDHVRKSRSTMANLVWWNSGCGVGSCANHDVVMLTSITKCADQASGCPLNNGMAYNQVTSTSGTISSVGGSPITTPPEWEEIVWESEHHASFAFANGGSYGEASGRFSLDFAPVVGEPIGMRCSVLIED